MIDRAQEMKTKSSDLYLLPCSAFFPCHTNQLFTYALLTPLLLLANSRQSFPSCSRNGTCRSSNLFQKLAWSSLIIKFFWEKEKYNNPFFQLEFHFQLIFHLFGLFPFLLRIVDMHYSSTVSSTMLTCKKL